VCMFIVRVRMCYVQTCVCVCVYGRVRTCVYVYVCALVDVSEGRFSESGCQYELGFSVRHSVPVDILLRMHSLAPTDFAVTSSTIHSPRSYDCLRLCACMRTCSHVAKVTYHKERHAFVRTFCSVLKASGEEAAVRHPDRTLFLCWPESQDKDWHPWAEDTVRAYHGDYVIYVGR
jgi:hypothetical protein